MKKKVIIFDLDGVLCDSIAFAQESWLYLYPDMTPETHKEILSGNFHEELEKFRLTHPGRLQTPEERKAYSLEYSKRKLELPMYPGMIALIKKLHSDGYILAINTSARERNCVPLLKRDGLDACFDFIGAKETAKSKREKFAMIQEKYSVSQSEMIFVTDTLGDIREAEQAGIPTIAVTWGGHAREYLTGEHNTCLVAVADSVKELEDLLRAVR